MSGEAVGVVRDVLAKIIGQQLVLRKSPKEVADVILASGILETAVRVEERARIAAAIEAKRDAILATAEGVFDDHVRDLTDREVRGMDTALDIVRKGGDATDEHHELLREHDAQHQQLIAAIEALHVLEDYPSGGGDYYSACKECGYVSDDMTDDPCPTRRLLGNTVKEAGDGE